MHFRKVNYFILSDHRHNNDCTVWERIVQHSCMCMEKTTTDNNNNENCLQWLLLYTNQRHYMHGFYTVFVISPKLCIHDEFPSEETLKEREHSKRSTTTNPRLFVCNRKILNYLRVHNYLLAPFLSAPHLFASLSLVVVNKIAIWIGSWSSVIHDKIELNYIRIRHKWTAHCSSRRACILHILDVDQFIVSCVAVCIEVVTFHPYFTFM